MTTGASTQRRDARGRYAAPDAALVRRAGALAAEGLTRAEVAAALGIGKRTAIRWRARPDYTDAYEEAMARLWPPGVQLTWWTIPPGWRRRWPKELRPRGARRGVDW